LEGADMSQESLPTLKAAAMLFFLCGFSGGCASGWSPPQRPPEKNQGPLAESPKVESGDYWIYERADGNRMKATSVTQVVNVDFPLWLGRTWLYQSGALPIGQPQTSKAHRAPVNVTCEAIAFSPIVVPAGRFDAFECRCECKIAGGPGVYESECGEWNFWYAPAVNNVVKVKTGSTASSIELASYNVAGKGTEPVTFGDFYNRGNSFQQKRDYDRAIQDYDQAIRLNPKDAAAFLSRGIAYSEKKEYDRAIEDYDLAIRLNPSHARAFYNRARAYSDKKDDERALQDYNKAIGLDPTYSSSFNNRGILYQAKKDYDRAIHDYDEAIRLDPKNASAFYNRGLAYRAKKDDARAMQDYNEAIRLNPQYRSALNNRGVLYADKRDYDRAIQYYNDSIRSDPSYAVAFRNRGNAYRAKMDNDRALSDYNEAIRLDPKNFSGLRNRGATQFYKGQFTAASSDLAKATELEPSNLYAAIWLYLAENREGQNGRDGLERRLLKFDLTKWPGAVIQFYLDKIDEKGMYAAAEDPDPKKKTERICEAHFYAAQVKLLKGTGQDAIPLLRAAAEKECQPTFYETQGARAELKRLGQ
jgi:tetratricopeptide (TPR) repeat protein